MLDTLLPIFVMEKDNIKMVLLVASLVCVLSSSFGEVNVTHDVIPDTTINKEIPHLEYTVHECRGSSVCSENQNYDPTNLEDKVDKGIGNTEDVINKRQETSENKDPCSPGKKWFNVCEKENRKCELKDSSPYAHCTDCKDGYVKMKIFFGDKCVAYCSPGTDSKNECDKQNKACDLLEKKPFFKCGKCKQRFQEKDNHCVEFCTKGTMSEKFCSQLNKNCKSQTTEPYFNCKGCKETYEEVGNSCLDICANGTKSEKNCSSQHRICEKIAKKPYFGCTDCFEDYVLKNDKCIKYCDEGTEGQIHCSNLNKECHLTKDESSYECADCLNGFTNSGDKCVEYCTEGTSSEKKCSADNKECQKDTQSPFFHCGRCKNGFIESNNKCVAHCEEGTVSEKECTAMNKTCEKKEEAPFYSCGKCKPQFGKKGDKCLDHCAEELRGHRLCKRQNKNCVPITTGLFYKCTDCIFGYVIDKENKKYCVNPCEKDEIGWDECSGVGRECVFKRGEVYKCGNCSNSSWIEDGERCIDPCERIFPSEKNITWSEACRNANSTCKYNHNLNTMSCVCHEKNKTFNWNTLTCGSYCDLLFPNEEYATWSEICDNANATCSHDYKLNETSCTCLEKSNIFNMSAKSCIDPCLIEKGGISWEDFCTERNATCIVKDLKGDVTCKCNQISEEFDDHNETCKELHPCDLPQEIYPCKNNGTCESINSTGYKCTCNSAWYGNHCEHRNLCSDETLCHPANCSMDQDSHTYSCTCKDDEYFNYDRKICEEIACFGKTCSIFRECQNGTCICREGFEEENGECKMTDKECERQCRRENVVCVNVSSPTEFTCLCKEGYHLNPNSLTCEASLCVFPFHPCEQNCNIVNGNEICSCQDGFRLVDNYTCEVDSENMCKEKSCENGVCIKKGGKESCICDYGFINFNDTQCTDMCEYSSHDSIQSLCPNGCIRNGDKIRCICTGKYIQATDGISCVENNYCQIGNIGEIECQKQGKVCSRHNEQPWYKCICPNGHRGKDGEMCTDSCSEEKSEQCALTQRTCKYSDGVETCHCPFSMTFDKNSNKCQFAKHFYHLTVNVKIEQSDTRMMHSSMLAEENLRKSFSESMKLLFGPSILDTDVIECSGEEDFTTCTFSLTFGEDADEVKSRLWSCKTLESSNESCIFPPKLIISRTSLETANFSSNKCDKIIKKRFCPHDSNECHPMSPGYSCLCKEGFTPVYSFILGYNLEYQLQTCEDIDECKNNPCWGNSTCENTYGSFVCNCKVGYVLNNKKDGCQGVCDDNPCGNNGKCKLFGDHGYKCECNKGFRGITCMEEDVYLKSSTLNVYITGAILGTAVLLSIVAIVVSFLKLHKETHDTYDLQMNNEIKYETSKLSQFNGVMKTEYNSMPYEKEKV